MPVYRKYPQEKENYWKELLARSTLVPEKVEKQRSSPKQNRSSRLFEFSMTFIQNKFRIC
jgi:hypothetical protein